MSVELITPGPEHAEDLARICFEAFGALQDRHRVPRDFEVIEGPRMLMGMMLRRPDFLGVAAVEGGRLVGSNFLQVSDEVAAVGPITVDPAVQGRGVGRALMLAVMRLAEGRGFARVRLFQEAINAASLSLYTSLGFVWRESAALMQLKAGERDEPGVRPMAEGDLAAVEAISREGYGHTRRAETAAALEWEFPAFVLERGGQLAAYYLPGYFGHGHASSSADMLALMAHAARHAPPPFQRSLVPLGQGAFYRECLRAGHRTLKLFNFMSLGPYTPPREVWIPTIGC